MTDKRPININPLSIRLPITAIVSILHRISGFLVFLLIPLLLWILELTLKSQSGFSSVQQLLNAPLLKFSIWVFVASLIFHLLAGFRHLLMDMHLGESLKGGRFGAKLVIAVSFVLIAGAAYCLWG